MISLPGILLAYTHLVNRIFPQFALLVEQDYLKAI